MSQVVYDLNDQVIFKIQSISLCQIIINSFSHKQCEYYPCHQLDEIIVCFVIAHYIF